MNALCSRCNSWMTGGDDERDDDGEPVRDEYGNRLRVMDCGHEVRFEEPDSADVVEDDPGVLL